MKRLFLQHGSPYDYQDVEGWMMSEKLDGSRGFWAPQLTEANDPGEEPTGLWTRDGKVIHAPDWWLDRLPNMPLDGELYLGRGMFQETQSIVRRKTPDPRWEEVKFMVFDMPTHFPQGVVEFKNTGKFFHGVQLHTFANEYPYHKIYSYLQRELPQNKTVRLVEQDIVQSLSHIDRKMAEVLDAGGEGLMLRDPNSYYTYERVKTLLKIKAENQIEVKVVGWFYGDGKYLNMMGALEVEWEGKTFKVSGFTDRERRVEKPGVPFSRGEGPCVFQIGQPINIKYRELSDDGVPKEGRYAR